MWKTYWIGVMACGACVPASAQWQLIDDFQQWKVGEIYTEAEDIGWSASSGSGSDEYYIFEDPGEPDNRVLNVYPGFLYNQPPESTQPDTVWFYKELPDGGIAPGETGTLHVRYFRTGRDNAWYWGASARIPELDENAGMLADPGEWDGYSALIRIPTMDVLAQNDGDEFVDTNPAVAVRDNTWYELFMVIRNSFEEVDGTWRSTGSYTLYLREPGDSVPRLIPVGTNPPRVSARFRREPLDEHGNPQPISSYLMSTRAGWPAPSSWNPWFVDDLYFSRGMNLSSIPSGDSPVYGGYEWATPNGDVSTGPFLGWLNITQAPYIWSYSLNSWIYMEEPAAVAPGAWGYFLK